MWWRQQTVGQTWEQCLGRSVPGQQEADPTLWVSGSLDGFCTAEWQDQRVTLGKSRGKWGGRSQRLVQLPRR